MFVSLSGKAALKTAKLGALIIHTGLALRGLLANLEQRQELAKIHRSQMECKTGESLKSRREIELEKRVAELEAKNNDLCCKLACSEDFAGYEAKKVADRIAEMEVLLNVAKEFIGNVTQSDAYECAVEDFQPTYTNPDNSSPVADWEAAYRRAFQRMLSQAKLEAITLQRWEPGTEPPVGWYWFGKENELVRVDECGILFFGGDELLFDYWESDILYGPIPDPEVSHG